MDVAARNQLLRNVRTLLYAGEEVMLRQLAKAAKGGEEDEGWTKEDLFVIIEEKLDNSDKEEDKGMAMLTSVLETIHKINSMISQKQTGQPSKTVKLDTLRRDFKLSGQIGDSVSNIGYMSFLRQVEIGKTKGYSDAEIVDGVIRAIDPVARIRGYLEGREALTLSTLQTIIRTYYKEKTSTELYQELCTLTQVEGESVQDFIFCAMELRQKIIFASKEDASLSYDAKLVERQYRHTVLTGIRDDNIRTELQTAWSASKTDEEVLQTLNEITQRHQERQQKLRTPSDPVKAKIHGVSGTESEDIMTELKALRLEVNEMRHKWSGAQSGGPTPGEANRFRMAGTRRKCSACREGNQSKGTHCYGCGSGQHFRRDCTENVKRGQPEN